MAMKLYKPTTPGRRGMSVIDYSVLSKVEPEKSLLAPLNKKAGRNSYGRITVRHRGGGNRRKYRIIDFKRNKFDVPGTVVSIEYDPNRSAHIALLQYEDGEKRYIVAPQGLSVGDVVTSGASADIKPGNALPLANIPTGTFIHNVELYPGKGAQLARSAGTMAQLMGQGKQPGDDPSALRRNAVRAAVLHGHHRSGGQRGAREREDRQGRPETPHGLAPDGARLGHEPLRSPPRRW